MWKLAFFGLFMGKTYTSNNLTPKGDIFDEPMWISAYRSYNSLGDAWLQGLSLGFSEVIGSIWLLTKLTPINRSHKVLIQRRQIAWINHMISYGSDGQAKTSRKQKHSSCMNFDLTHFPQGCPKRQYILLVEVCLYSDLSWVGKDKRRIRWNVIQCFEPELSCPSSNFFWRSDIW